MGFQQRNMIWHLFLLLRATVPLAAAQPLHIRQPIGWGIHGNIYIILPCIYLRLIIVLRCKGETIVYLNERIHLLTNLLKQSLFNAINTLY